MPHRVRRYLLHRFSLFRYLEWPIIFIGVFAAILSILHFADSCTNANTTAPDQSFNERPIPLPVIPGAYHPIEVLPLRIEPDVFGPGATVTLTNGICILSVFETERDENGLDVTVPRVGDPVIVQIFVGAQPLDVADDLLEGRTIPLIGESDSDIGRDRVPLDPTRMGPVDGRPPTDRCIYAQPVKVEVPLDFPPGTYRLYVHIRVESNGRVQDEVDFSNEFTVLQAFG